jgi:hypothetical protein
MFAKNMIFSDGQVLTSTANATDDVNMGVGKDAFGAAKPGDPADLWLLVRCRTTFAGGTSLACKLQDSADGSTFADTPIVGSAVALASLVAGAWQLRVRVPRGTRQYLRIVYTIVGTMSGSSTIDAGLSDVAEQLS